MRTIVIDPNQRGSRSVRATLMAEFAVGGPEPHPRLVDIFICKLRQRLRAASGELIRTEWSRGYFLPNSRRAA